MKSVIAIGPLALVLILAGCGGAGVGSGSNASTSLGARAVPGGSIKVEKATAITPGSPATFRITVDTLVATQVRAWIAVDYDATAIGVLAISNGDGTFDVTIAVPSSMLASSNLWVRLTEADGTVIETGNDDYNLN